MLLSQENKTLLGRAFFPYYRKCTGAVVHAVCPTPLNKDSTPAKTSSARLIFSSVVSREEASFPLTDIPGGGGGGSDGGNEKPRPTVGRTGELRWEGRGELLLSTIHRGREPLSYILTYLLRPFSLYSVALGEIPPSPFLLL